MTLTTRTITNAGAPLYATDGAILANATITFALVDHIGVRSDAWDAVTSERVGGDPILTTTDASGEFTVALWPNSRGATATRYLCTVNSAGFRPFYGVVEDAAQPLPWVSFMASGSPLTPQEISQLTQYLDEIEAAKLEAEAARDAAEDAAQAAIDSLGGKVDKVAGKGLSTEDYTTAEKNKLAAIASGATANATDAQLRDRATHTGAQAINTVTGLQGALDAKEAAGTAATAVSSHVAAGDPHPQYTTAAEAAAAAPVQSVAGKTGAVTLAKADVGLSNVDNTADSAKPVSTAQAAAIATATAIHPFLLIGA